MNRRDAIKALIALPGVVSIAEAKLEPGDVLVFEVDHFLSYEQRCRILDTVDKVWPGRKAVVLDRGMTLKIAKAVDG